MILKFTHQPLILLNHKVGTEPSWKSYPVRSGGRISYRNLEQAIISGVRLGAIEFDGRFSAEAVKYMKSIGVKLADQVVSVHPLVTYYNTQQSNTRNNTYGSPTEIFSIESQDYLLVRAPGYKNNAITRTSLEAHADRIGLDKNGYTSRIDLASTVTLQTAKYNPAAFEKLGRGSRLTRLAESEKALIKENIAATNLRRHIQIHQGRSVLDSLGCLIVNGYCVITQHQGRYKNTLFVEMSHNTSHARLITRMLKVMGTNGYKIFASPGVSFYGMALLCRIAWREAYENGLGHTYLQYRATKDQGVVLHES